MSKSRTIVFVNLDISEFGGVERVICNLANQFVRDGFDVVVASMYGSGKSAKYTLDARVKLIQFRAHGIDRKRYKIDAIFFLRWLARELRVFADYVLISTFPLFSIYFGLLFPRLRVKIIAAEHSSYWAHNSVIRAMRIFSYKKLAKVVTLTEIDASEFRSRGVCVNVIPNPVSIFENQGQFDSDLKHGDNFLCLGLGRLHAVKRFDLLIEVSDYLQSKDPSVLFAIVGSGPIGEDLKTLAESRRLKNLKFYPATKKVSEHLRNASVLLIMSDSEAFPMVLLEANSFGVPVISYNDINGARALIREGINGWMFVRPSIEAIGDHILKISRDKNLLDSVKKSSIAVAKEYEVSGIASRWYNIIWELE